MPTYHSASGSAAEDLFIDLFSEAFGAEKAGYLTLSIIFMTSTRIAVMRILYWKTVPIGLLLKSMTKPRIISSWYRPENSTMTC